MRQSIKVALVMSLFLITIQSVVFADNGHPEPLIENILEWTVVVGYLFVAITLFILTKHFSGDMKLGMLYGGLAMLFIGAIKEIIEMLTERGILTYLIPLPEISELIGIILLIIGTSKFYKGTPKFK